MRLGMRGEVNLERQEERRAVVSQLVTRCRARRTALYDGVEHSFVAAGGLQSEDFGAAESLRANGDELHIAERGRDRIKVCQPLRTQLSPYLGRTAQLWIEDVS